VLDWFVYKNDIHMKWSPISILNGLSVEQCCAVASRPNHQSALMFVAGTVLFVVSVVNDFAMCRLHVSHKLQTNKNVALLRTCRRRAC